MTDHAERLAQLIGAYGLQCHLTGELAPSRELVDAINGAYDAHRTAVPDEWLPIESAPRDGTWILGSHTHWDDPQECPPVVCYWQSGDEDQNGWFGEGSTPTYFSPQPNLWMPLPAPPQDKG
jgi:hypothetical protein